MAWKDCRGGSARDKREIWVGKVRVGGSTRTTRRGIVSVTRVGSACFARFLALGEPRGAGAGAKVFSCGGFFFLGGGMLSDHSIALTAAFRKGATTPIGLRLPCHHLCRRKAGKCDGWEKEEANK